MSPVDRQGGESMAERMKHGPKAQLEQMSKAERKGSEPSDVALLIGTYLERNPPWGMRDRYSASGWAHIVQAVLNAWEVSDV